MIQISKMGISFGFLDQFSFFPYERNDVIVSLWRDCRLGVSLKSPKVEHSALSAFTSPVALRTQRKASSCGLCHSGTFVYLKGAFKVNNIRKSVCIYYLFENINTHVSKYYFLKPSLNTSVIIHNEIFRK